MSPVPVVIEIQDDVETPSCSCGGGVCCGLATTLLFLLTSGLFAFSVVSLILEFPDDECKNFILWVYVLVKSVTCFQCKISGILDESETVVSYGMLAACIPLAVGITCILMAPDCIPHEMLFTSAIIYVAMDAFLVLSGVFCIGMSAV